MEREALKALIDKALARNKVWNGSEAGSPKGMERKGAFVPLENGAGASSFSPAGSAPSEFGKNGGGGSDALPWLCPAAGDRRRVLDGRLRENRAQDRLEVTVRQGASGNKAAA